MRTLLWLLTLLAALIVAAGYEWHASTAMTRELAAAEQRVAGLRRAVDAATTALAEQKAAERAAEEKWDVVAAERAVEQRYGPAPAKVWRARVKALQDAIARSPADQIPELALLQLKDWIDAAVRAEGASPPELRKVLAALRQTGRVRVAEKIQAALKRYLETSDGTLPGSLQELRRFLPAAITAEMLAPYRLTKTGKPANAEDRVIEGQFGIVTISLTPTSWASNARSNDVASEDVPAVLSGLAGANAPDEFTAWQGRLVAAMHRVGPMMDHLLPDDAMAAIGPQVKAAVQQYVQAQHGRPPRSMEDLQPILPAAATLAQALRPVVANLEYAFEHDGQLPADPARLQRYLNALDDAQLLRRMRLTMKEGGHVDLDFNLTY